MDRNEVVSQFVSLTNCSDNEASFYLEAANYDLDRAVAMFYGAHLEVNVCLKQNVLLNVVKHARRLPRLDMHISAVL